MLKNLERVLLTAFMLYHTLPDIIQCQNPIQNSTDIIDQQNATNASEPAPLCLKIFNLSTKSSACLVARPKTFEESYEFCLENNMTLLEIHSESEKKILFKVAREFFGTGGGTVIWIDGKWSFELNEWRKYQTNESFSLSTKIKTPLDRFFGEDDYCLSVQSYFVAQYEIAPIRCYNKCYFFCEDSSVKKR